MPSLADLCGDLCLGSLTLELLHFTVLFSPAPPAFKGTELLGSKSSWSCVHVWSWKTFHAAFQQGTNRNYKPVVIKWELK